MELRLHYTFFVDQSNGRDMTRAHKLYRIQTHIEYIEYDALIL